MMFTCLQMIRMVLRWCKLEDVLKNEPRFNGTFSYIALS